MIISPKRSIITVSIIAVLIGIGYFLHERENNRRLIRNYVGFPKWACHQMQEINEFMMKVVEISEQANDRLALLGQPLNIPKEIDAQEFLEIKEFKGLSQRYDPWGNEYKILIGKTVKTEILIISAGPDGKFNNLGKYHLAAWENIRAGFTERIIKKRIPTMDDLVFFDGMVFCGPKGVGGIGHW